jgi:hypothetical protein
MHGRRRNVVRQQSKDMEERGVDSTSIIVEEQGKVSGNKRLWKCVVTSSILGDFGCRIT